jgi:phage tail protein X
MTVPSRYKDTLVYLDGGTRSQGVFKCPDYLSTPTPEWKNITLRATDLGQLDAVAVRLYGPGMEALWWVILQANGVVHQERELKAGSVLRVPPASAVDTFMSQ